LNTKNSSTPCRGTPAIDYSTLVVARRGVGAATVRGEVIFSGRVRMVVSERLMLDAGVLRIVSYGYEVWRGAEKLGRVARLRCRRPAP